MCRNYFRAFVAQNSRRDAIFGSAMAAEGRNKCSNFWGYTVSHQFFNSSRCGHGDIIIDPSAFKENVASGTGFLSRSWQNILSGSKAERYEWVFFFSYL